MVETVVRTLLTRGEARRIALSVAKPLELLRR
jgi:hypothetical protein